MGQKLHISKQVASAIHYMHAQTPQAIHYDLKSANILVSSQEVVVITHITIMILLSFISIMCRLPKTTMYMFVTWG